MLKRNTNMSGFASNKRSGNSDWQGADVRKWSRMIFCLAEELALASAITSSSSPAPRPCLAMADGSRPRGRRSLPGHHFPTGKRWLEGPGRALAWHTECHPKISKGGNHCSPN